MLPLDMLDESVAVGIGHATALNVAPEALAPTLFDSTMDGGGGSR